MKSKLIIVALWFGASAWAQTPPQKQVVVRPAAASPVAAKPSPAPLPKGQPNTTKASAAVASQNTKPQAVKTSVKPTPASAKAAGSATAVRRVRPARKSTRMANRPMIRHRDNTTVAGVVQGAPRPGRRDPFVSPMVERVHVASTCTGTGRQCLLAGEVTLQGVVQSPGGFIAVVMNGDHTYFLRENDPLANGTVERITQDAIILRERSSDVMGHATTHEITRKIGVPAA